MSDQLHPSHFSLEFAIRPTLLKSAGYVTSTSDQVQRRPAVVLDANENSAGNCLVRPYWLRKWAFSWSLGIKLDSLKRYPSASQCDLKDRIAQWRRLDSIESVHLGSGASDVLDLILRATCTPFQDSIVVTPPTFDLYKARAEIYNIGVHECPLKYREGDFVLPVDEICDTITFNPNIKLVILASPGNPTGSLIPLKEIRRILDLEIFHGILVVDEAYIDFSSAPKQSSTVQLLFEYSNLVVVQSLSKSHGLAGIRVGMAFAHPAIVSMFTKLQMPFGISTPTLSLATKALSPRNVKQVLKVADQVRANRQALETALKGDRFRQLGVGSTLGGNQANFVVFPILNLAGEKANRDDERAKAVVAKLREIHGIGVRYIGRALHCEACVRVTVGRAKEQKLFLQALQQVLSAT